MASRRQRQWRRDLFLVQAGEAPPYRAIEMEIGKELRARYEPPAGELPLKLLALLMQMNGKHDSPERR
jgi:hypothetical protein